MVGNIMGGTAGLLGSQMVTDEVMNGVQNQIKKENDAVAEKKAEDNKNSEEKGTGSKIWDFLTLAENWFNINLYETLHTKRNFTLSDINFVPLYVQNHVANDFYTKMFTQLYPDPPVAPESKKNSDSGGGIWDTVTGAISNVAGAAVSKISNTISNQITSTANYARNLISTLTFGLVDTSKTTTNGENLTYSLVQNAIPHLKVTEIRLNDKLSQKGILFTCMGKMFQAGESLAKGNNGLKNIGQKIAKGFDKGLDAILNATIHMTADDWLSKMTSGQMSDAMATRIGGIAYSFIRNSASGQFMNTYELPHFGSPTMLKSLSDGFQGPPPMDNPILKVINDFTGGNLTLMENISWKAPQKLSMDPFTGTFYLFNDNLNMYVNNLDFVLRVVTHSMPIRDSFMYRAPCCYDVTDVGNRRCYFCRGEFIIKKIGKIRKLSESPSVGGSNFVYADNLMKSIKEQLITSAIPSDEINDDIIDYVPDAFEVTYTFTPLISENYNTFVYYFLEQGGNPSTSVLPVYENKKTGETLRDTTSSTAYGSQIDYLSDKLMKDFVDAFTSELGGDGSGTEGA